jgi:hypothetical protein
MVAVSNMNDLVQLPTLDDAVAVDTRVVLLLLLVAALVVTVVQI